MHIALTRDGFFTIEKFLIAPKPQHQLEVSSTICDLRQLRGKCEYFYPVKNELATDSEPAVQTLPGIDEGEIIVIRSKRRKRNLSAYRQGGRIVISIPASMSKADERAMVPEMIAKIRSQESAKTPTESVLTERIDALLSQWAPEITQRPASVAWRSMRERWGSCTSVDRTIRISDRLQLAPDYALDYVLFHEAIHPLQVALATEATATLPLFGNDLVQHELCGN